MCVYFPLLNFSSPVYSSRMALPVHTCVRTYIRIYMYVYLHEYVLCIQASYCISQILCMVSCSQALPSVCTVSLLNSQNIICGICGASQGCFIYRHFCENLNKTHTTRYVLGKCHFMMLQCIVVPMGGSGIIRCKLRRRGYHTHGAGDSTRSY